jgi:serine/threonine-protein kinase RsbT
MVKGERVGNELTVTIGSDGDLLAARQQVRAMALDFGFALTEVVGIVTALSEMARNMLTYAGKGELQVEFVMEGDRLGVFLTAVDEGPGIPDIPRAMQDGYSTSGGLGMGLPGIRRLMDDFDIQSEPQKGTTVRAGKWRNHR